MIKSLTRDESGLALPLAIVVMVIIGVMGAGLLVFVGNDLEAVVEANQGQQALEIAEAGVMAAKQQQLSDVVRQHYDDDYTNDCESGQRLGPDWSPSTTVWNSPNDCSGGTDTRSTPGVTREFAGGEFNVVIECFDQLGDSADPCSGIDEEAPESIEASKRAYFKITSTGYYPADGSGAKRRVEAIYHTNRLDVPTAYYTPNNIEFNGGVDIEGVSFFAGGDITKTPSASLTVERCKSPLPSPAPPGCPALYGDWDTTNPANFTPTSNLNTTARPVDGAGFAAEGTVDDFGAGTRNIYDYDSNTSTKFVCKSTPSSPSPPCDSATINEPNSPETISYPFNPNREFDLGLLESIARSQDNYYEGDIDIDTTTVANKVEYPESSTDLTVFYVKANGADIDYNVDYNPRARGLIVIEDGNLEISNSSRGFNGAVIVTGDDTRTCGSAGATGCYENIGTRTVEGFVVADNTMRLGGDVGPSAAIGDYTQRPGFFDMQLWNWRELYE